MEQLHIRNQKTFTMNYKKFKVCIGYFIFQFISQVSYGQSGSEVQIVTSNCDWKPPTDKAMIEISKQLPNNKVLQESVNSPSYQIMIIAEKGRKYFHSLPNKNCKSDIFIVRNDKVFWLDSYEDGSDQYEKVAYFSVSMNKIIVGWIASKGVCQYEPTQSLKVRCGI